MTEVTLKHYMVRMPAKAHQKMKILAIKRECGMNEIFVQAIREYLERQGD